MSTPTRRLAALTVGFVMILTGLVGGSLGRVSAAPADATTARPVTGIARPCAVEHPWPADASLAQIRDQLARNTGLALVGPGWTEQRNRPLVQIIWQTLDALGCTSYLDVITKNHPGLELNAAPIRGWALGDWGLTRPGALTLDLAKWQAPLKSGDEGRLVRLFVHELGHAWSRTPQAQPVYERFATLHARIGNFSDYGRGSVNENFSEVIGYYVARCAIGNPYDARVKNKGQYDPYYELVKQHVFDGHEFGPAVGQAADCTSTGGSLPAPTVARSPKTVKAVPDAEAPVTRVIKESLDR